MDVGARSRSPRTVEMSGALRSVCACRRDSATRMPVEFTLFTRAIPAANSGASSPLSAASAASLRIADIRMMIDDEPRPRASRDTRQALIVALVKPGRGACRNHAMNSFQRHVVHPARNRRRHAVEHERLQLLAFCELLHHSQIVHCVSCYWGLSGEVANVDQFACERPTFKLTSIQCVVSCDSPGLTGLRDRQFARSGRNEMQLK
jgi:hypothetical protein